MLRCRECGLGSIGAQAAKAFESSPASLAAPIPPNTSVAGDALRVAKITKAFGQLRRNLAAVLFDRIANLGVLLMVCLLLMFFISLGPAADHISIVLGLLAAAAAGGALALMLASRLRPLRRFRVVREVIYLSTMFRIVFLRPDRVMKVGLWSLFAQGIVVCSFAAAAYSVGISSLSGLELAMNEPTLERTAFVRFRKELVARNLDARLFDAVLTKLAARQGRSGGAVR